MIYIQIIARASVFFPYCQIKIEIPKRSKMFCTFLKSEKYDFYISPSNCHAFFSSPFFNERSKVLLSVTLILLTKINDNLKLIFFLYSLLLNTGSWFSFKSEIYIDTYFDVFVTHCFLVQFKNRGIH